MTLKRLNNADFFGILGKGLLKMAGDNIGIPLIEDDEAPSEGAKSEDIAAEGEEVITNG